MVDSPPKGQSAHTQELPLDPSQLVHVVHAGSEHKHETYLGEVTAKPHEQPHMSLGRFTPTSRLKGFAIELSPDPDPENSIVAHVVAVGTAKHYELVLHVANYGEKTINAQVWQIDAWPGQKGEPMA